MESPKFSPAELLSLEKARLTPEVIRELQERTVEAYLATMDQLDAHRRRARQLHDEAEAAKKLAAIAAPWSNGPCVYCHKDDGKTEIRSMGPIHLTGCFARHTTVQRKKVMKTIKAIIGAIALVAMAAPAVAQDAPTIISTCAQQMESRFPGQRIQDLEGYTAKVAFCASGVDPRIGRKATTSTSPISLSTLGVRATPGDTGMALITAVDFVRDETSLERPTNPIRPQPIIHPNVTQFWIRAAAADLGGPTPVPDPDPVPDPEPTPEPGVELGPLLLKVVALLEEIKDGQAALRVGQEAQTSALRAAIAELQAQVKAGVKIRF